MAGLSQEQIAMLKKMPGIDQNLLTTYEKNNVSTTAKADSLKTDTLKPRAEVKPSEKVTGLQNFSAALQEAISLAREQRQSSELDYIGGKIPKGAVTASQFTGLLANLNQASDSFTEPLAKTAIEFVQDEQTSLEDQRASIRDLALSVVEAGGSTEVVNGILKATDIDSAIGMAAGALNTKGKLKVEQIGGNLVQYDPADPEGTMKVIYGGGKNNSSSSNVPDDGVDVVEGFDFMGDKIADVKVKAKQMFAPTFSTKLISELTDEELRLFLNDYFEESNSAQMSIDPDAYYTEWKQAAGVNQAKSSAVVNPFKKQ